ncbi:MAG: hypothetical protein Q7J27_12055 [Syntrophales bacterium]|nr:hypothetical protein [Syntrophales bacterium]
MAEDRYKDVENIYRNPGEAIEGDKILIYCRKPSRWLSNIRGSGGHHYFKTTARMNALAVLTRTFKNLQK